LLPADSPLRSSYVAEIANYEANQRNDKILGIIASVLLIISLAMLSRPDGLKPHRHRRLA
jgi:hypothetical protein